MKTKQIFQLAALAAASVWAVGCGGTERTEAEWQDDTAKMFERHAATIKGCYEQALSENPDLKGRLIIKYNIANRSGRVKSVKFDGNSTLSNPGMQRCIERVLEKQSYDPGDVNNGRATVVIDFKATVTDDNSKGDDAKPES